MAHYRNKRTTSKAENKRIDHKKQRSVEAQALRGDNLRVARGLSWGVKLDQAPVLNDVMPHKGKRRKVRKPKEHCPVNRTHEWYKEVVEESRPRWYSPYYWLYGDRHDGHWVHYEATVRVETCIHCWKERKKTLKYRYVRS